uniref:Mu opioid receptor isoform MOR-1K n=1 Tax=Mus musculus TaxID=10090 RepID=Q4U2P1_MOUSE|nr:mu opioid receptor isoform MOR-1L [Mus musculus]AAL34402.1 mu opioid receptor isoform MOR-1K [Mus musculus]
MMEAFSKSAFQKLRQRDGNQEGKSYLRHLIPRKEIIFLKLK